ncbi:MAG: DUF4363 family protein [Candidatus Ventricola sp.]
MSRKVITMLVTMALLAALCVIEQVVVHRITSDALEQTKLILADIRADAFAQAQEKAHALDQAWDREASKLEVMVDHGSTDEVRYALSRLLAALESRDKATALIYACELEGGIEHVYERQEFTLQNTF